VREDLARLECDAALVPFLTFLMNEDELGVFLYGDLSDPLPRNTDDFLVTEFSTPKHLAGDQTVGRFVQPQRLRGSPASLLGILCNVDETTLGAGH
jgi:hypothetical protein